MADWLLHVWGSTRSQNKCICGYHTILQSSAYEKPSSKMLLKNTKLFGNPELHWVLKNVQKGLPATMRFHADGRLHPAPGGLMKVVRCRPKGLLFEGSYRSPDRMQGRLLNAEHHFSAVSGKKGGSYGLSFLLFLLATQRRVKVVNRFTTHKSPHEKLMGKVLL